MFESVIRVHISVIYLHLLYDKLSILQSEKADSWNSKNKSNKVMAKKVLIISSSPRKGGNSDMLCDEFVKGALETGNEVEKIFSERESNSSLYGM